MRKQLFIALGLAATALSFGSGCLVVTGDDSNYSDGCFQECRDYEVCETYCDPWECWDECWYETTCDVSCPAAPAVQCVDDIDCRNGDICVAGACVADDTPSDPNATSGLCQACETTNDCVEEEARCIRLNYQHSNKQGEKICSRICEIDDDCPINFECVNVSQEAGVPAQCLPKADAGVDRTCTNNADLECVKAKECGVGESCVNNRCVAPANAECNADSECAAGEVCESYKCVAEADAGCIDRNDCAASEICIDGTCTAQNSSCVFNSECDGGKCVNGTCIAGCSSTDDCGPYERCRIPEGQTDGLCEQIECRRSSDCSAGELCVDAVCETACDADADCGDGYVCNNNNFCEEDPDIDCRTTAECATNEICSAGSCVQACGCNQDCPSGQVCDMGTGACSAPAGSMQGISCQDNCDCPSGQTCNSGTCG